MATDARILEITRTQLLHAPPARVMQLFFSEADLQGWWQVTRAFALPRPLGMYAIEWAPTDFKDDVLGRLGGSFHGSVIDFRANNSFFLADVYWMPPEGDPIGPMALHVTCDTAEASTRLRVQQSGCDDSPRWRRYYRVMGAHWLASLERLKREVE